MSSPEVFPASLFLAPQPQAFISFADVIGLRRRTRRAHRLRLEAASNGFDQSGAKVLIADPAAQGHGGGASWNNVPQTYWISLQDLGTWIGGKGYTG